jgi:hypothetical protein
MSSNFVEDLRKRRAKSCGSEVILIVPCTLIPGPSPEREKGTRSVEAFRPPLPFGRGDGGEGYGVCRSPDGLRERQSQLSGDFSQHVVEIVANLVVGEAQDMNAGALQHVCALVVVIGEPGVLSAVDFHNETRRAAIEVDNVGAERALTPRFCPVQA